MNWYSSERTLNKEGRKKIEDLDLECVFDQLTAPVAEGGYDWPRKEAREAINGYREFLIDALELEIEYNDEYPQDARAWPSKAVDIVWHTHILFTEKYFEDCDAIFGFYFHHRPQVPPPVYE